MQSIIQLTTCMFYQYTQSLLVSAQQYGISFNAADHGRKLELLFFNKWLTDMFCSVAHICIFQRAESIHESIHQLFSFL